MFTLDNKSYSVLFQRQVKVTVLYINYQMMLHLQSFKYMFKLKLLKSD